VYTPRTLTANTTTTTITVLLLLQLQLKIRDIISYTSRVIAHYVSTRVGSGKIWMAGFDGRTPNSTKTKIWQISLTEAEL